MKSYNFIMGGFLLLMVAVAGCSSSRNAKNPPDLNNEYVAFTTDSLTIEVNTPHFSDAAREQLKIDADSIGKHVLSQMVNGYSNSRTKRVMVTEDPQQAGMHINISKIIIKRGWFTIDITHPGPLYRMRVKLDTGIKGRSYHVARGKAFENMANYTGEPTSIKWLNPEEKDDFNIQLRTAHAGVREALGDAMADIFQISNYYR